MTDKIIVQGEPRFAENAPRVGEIYETMDQAIAPLAGIGSGIQAAERAVVRAVATALWLAHGKHKGTLPIADVVGDLKLGMDAAGWHGSFAAAAASLLGRVMRFTPEEPMTRAACISEADHFASIMFAQQTKRREREREERAKKKREKAEREKAEKAAEKAERGDATDAAAVPEAPQWILAGGPDQLDTISEAEYIALRDVLVKMRADAAAYDAQIRKAEREAAKADKALPSEIRAVA